MVVLWESVIGLIMCFLVIFVSKLCSADIISVRWTLVPVLILISFLFSALVCDPLHLCLCFSIFPSPDQQGGASHGPTMLNTGGSLPDLSSLHFPSPLPTPLDPDEPGYPSLSGGSSTGNLTCTLTHLGINSPNALYSTGQSCDQLHTSSPYWTKAFICSNTARIRN